MQEEIDLTQKKVLLVEDEALVADLIQMALLREKIEVDIVRDGNSVLEAVNKTAYHLILLDLGLPDKDGIAVLQELRALENYKYCPIIILTNYGDLEHIRQARELGATNYLIKSSIDYTKIKEVLTENLGLGTDQKPAA